MLVPGSHDAQLFKGGTAIGTKMWGGKGNKNAARAFGFGGESRRGLSRCIERGTYTNEMAATLGAHCSALAQTLSLMKWHAPQRAATTHGGPRGALGTATFRGWHKRVGQHS